MEISVAESMSIMKNLEERIEQKTKEITFVTVVSGDAVAVGYKTNLEFEEKVKSNFQSLNALIKRKTAIKSAIVVSNATTRLMVGDKSMFVAEAIEHKNHIKKSEDVLFKMTSALQFACTKVEKEIELLKPRLDAYLMGALGANKTGKEDQIKILSEQFKETNGPRIIDPIGLVDAITKLSDEISEFHQKVDFAINKSNIITMIQIPDN